MFRYIRIAILLTILAVVAGDQWLTKSRFSSWDKPLWVTIYPLQVQPDASIRAYTEKLKPDSFQEIEVFIKKQSRRLGNLLEDPLVIQVAQAGTSLPPALPPASSGVKIALWSLKMRWWVWKNSDHEGLAPADIKIFVLYQQRKPEGQMERSVGIQNGGYGVVNAVASRQMAAHNRIVITHELMHILGATDKYDLATGQPLAPEGLANPLQSPLYPQNRAEIMGGRIATTANQWRRPANLKACVIGAATAGEIGW
jgi:hypothetical protein